MTKRILCLCLVLMLTLCGCGDNSTTNGPSPSTSISNSSTSDESIRTTASTVMSTSTETTSMSSYTTQEASTTLTTSSGTTHTTATANTSTTNTTHSTTTITSTRPITVFTATVRNNMGQPVSGVTVSVWMSADLMVGDAVTNARGVAQITLDRPYTSYLVKLSNIPNGYEANSEYHFSTTTVNITLRKAAVYNELDHSQAQYDVGKTMTNFALTDTNGNIYRLSDLLKEKKLVILDFWFATCQPCKKEFPFFETAVQTYGEDVALLAINPIDSLHTINALRNQLNANITTAITFPMLMDTCNLFLGFEVTNYPTTVFIDSTGRIMDIRIGTFPSKEALLSTIAQYLT